MRVAALTCLLLLSAAPAFGAELVDNGSFTQGPDGWWEDGNVTLRAADGAACAEVPGGTSNIWDLAIGQSDLRLEAGTEYTYSFRASATPGATVRAILQIPREPWTEYVSLEVEPTGELATYATKFTMTESMDDGQLALQIGGSDAPWTLCVDDVSLNDAPAAIEVVGPPSLGDPNPQDTGPRVRVNQVGYLPDGPKKGTIVTVASEPLPFVVKDEIGSDVFFGMTVPRGFDQSAGLTVHVADFSAFTGRGENFTLVADLDASLPFDIDPDLYDALRVDALSYFYPARSGIEILDEIAGQGYGRPAGHLGQPGGDAVNQGDLRVPCQPAEASMLVYGEPWTCAYTLDAAGGWYDAGDHGKYVVNGGIAVAQLLATYERALTIAGFAAPRAEGLDALGDGSLRVPETENGISDVLDEALWELQWFLEMIVPEGQPMAGMVHHKLHDNAWTDLPILPHEDPRPRELHRPSTSATLNAAAALAMGARLYDPEATAFPSTALSEAKTLWAAALQNPAVYAPEADGDTGGGAYADNDVLDEFYWGAAELFITTGEDEYLEYMRASPYWEEDPFTADGTDWSFLAGFARLELARNAGNLPPDDVAMIRQSVFDAAERYLRVQAESPFGSPYAPRNGRYDWGSNHRVLQIGLVMTTAYDLSGEERYRDGAIEAMDYILGRNAINQSYVTGWGERSSQNQHSSWMAWSLDPDLPRPLTGTLAGGPNSSLQDNYAKTLFAERGCAPQACYVDHIESWSTNELAINWNAALAQFAGWLADQ